jgi:hypothetical protein
MSKQERTILPDGVCNPPKTVSKGRDPILVRNGRPPKEQPVSTGGGSRRDREFLKASMAWFRKYGFPIPG